MNKGRNVLPNLRFCFGAVIISAVMAVTYVLWFNLQMMSIRTSRSYHLRKNITVLYWGYPWNIKSYVPPEGQLEDNCIVTHDRSKIKQADAVIFHYTVISKKDIPWKYYRHPDQIFLWWSAENPAILKMETNDGNAFDNFFNWTETYRGDADVRFNYGCRRDFINALPRGKQVVDDIIAAKKKLAIWIVSKCSYTIGARKRLAYAKELRKAGIDFDGYGKCFPESKHLPREGPEMPAAIYEHKFYFAFENGLHCKNYITEKFWHKGIGSSTVPIVWGPTKEDVLAVAPPDSFIFAEDFETPAKLAEYLKFVDSNDTEYRKYFRWREDEKMTDEKMMKMIKERHPEIDVQGPPKTLCEALTESGKRKTIASLDKLIMQNDPVECTG